MGYNEISHPRRVIVGHCPQCGEVVVVKNEGGSWPYVTCTCDWSGTTTQIANRVRFERGGEVT